ncbi:MAG: hypothetical protein OC190_00285 [Novosphingobium aromaticivorans]|nr:hypothetical protein [Novosphingobium aromaticivorans]
MEGMLMRRLILAPLGATAFTLAGCAAHSTPPVIEARVERVEVPVAVACVDPADVPAEPARAGDQLTGDAAHDAGVLAAVDLRLRAALDKALALISGCTSR